jgi:hypothetical protein
MKNLFKGNKHSYKIVLGLISIASALLGKACTSRQPNTVTETVIYHIEADYQINKGGKIIIDKH